MSIEGDNNGKCTFFGTISKNVEIHNRLAETKKYNRTT
jgi:hypothetical protein